MPFHCIVELHVTVNNIKPLSLATETQEGIPFVLLPGYKIVCTAANSQIVVRSSWEVPYVFVPFQPNLEFLVRFSYNFPVSHFSKIRRVGAALIHADRRTDRPDEANDRFFDIYANAPKMLKEF